ncbi:MAG: helix-turn-helix domain-containing protein [Bacillota bacterium]
MVECSGISYGIELIPKHKSEFTENLELYSCPILGIAKTKNPLTLYPDQHTHDSYEFLIPYVNMPSVKLGTGVINAEKNKVLPINSGVPHGPGKVMSGIHFLALEFEKNFMEEMAYLLLGSKELYYAPKSIPFSTELQLLCSMFMKENRKRQTGYHLTLDNISRLIAVTLLRASQIKKEAGNSRYSPEKREVLKVIEYINERYDSFFTLEELAVHAGFHPSYLVRAFKLQTGKTPYEYLQDVRIEHAKDLLKRQDLKITDVCYQVGFNNQSHFATLFKNKVGISPSYYRKIVSQTP